MPGRPAACYTPTMHAIPELHGGTPVSGPFVPRYDDITQDGRVSVLAFPHALGAVAWPAVTADPTAAILRADGVLPILVRMQVLATSATVSVADPLRGVGAWTTWTARSPDGAVDRIVLTMRVDLYGRVGHTYVPTPPDAPEVLVGTIAADHVFTRPFAPPERRRVVDLGGRVPEATGDLRRFEDVGRARGEALGDVDVAFGLTHTDSNRHVNSLVYPRMFADAGVRDRPDRALVRWFEIAWRKPFFAGEASRIRRWRASPGGDAEVGAFVDAAGAERCRLAIGAG